MSRNILNAPLPQRFPSAFLWGGATSSHQVHGSPGSNWDNFERSDERTQQLLKDGNNPAEFIAGSACEFELRYQSDFKLAKDLGHTAVRFSINWATVEPYPGKFDTKVLERYQRVVEMARFYKLEPIITLYHWTHSGSFEKDGSWRQYVAPQLFERFVDITLCYIGDRVTYYTVLNEPTVYSNFSFRWGLWPPQEATEEGYTHVVHNLAEAHRRAYVLIK